MTDTVDKIVIQAETSGVDQATSDVQGLSKAMDGVTVASASVEKSTGSIDSKFASLERRFSTTAGQAAQLAKVQKTVNDAVAANPALQDRADAVLAAATERYGAAIVAEKALGDAHGGLSTQGQAALHSIRSFGEQIALGIPPTQALTGQLNHLTYAATGEGGLKGAFSEVGGFISGILTPMRLVGAGIVGVAAGALYLGNSWQEAQSKVNQALIGIGERTGSTASDINNFAKTNSTATGLSIADSRNLGIELTKTGNIAVGSLTGVGAAVKGYSILTGKDATEATKDFAKAMSGDLVDGIKKLDAPFGSLNADTLEHIRNLDLQSAGTLDAAAKTQALQLWIDGLATSNKKAAESVGLLASSYQGFKNVASNIINGGITPTSDEKKLADLRAQRDASANAPNLVGSNPGGYGLLNTGGLAGGKSGQLADLDKQISDLQKKLDGVNAANAAAQLRALSEASDGVVHSFLPQIDAIHNLDKAISTLQLAQQKGVAAKGSDDALTVLQYQRDLAQDTLDKTIAQATVVSDLQEKYGEVSAQTAITLSNLQGQLAVASQRTVQGQIQAQEQAQINSLLTQGVSQEEAAQVAAAQRAVSEEKVYQNMQKAVDASNDQVKLAGAKGTAEEASVKAAIAYRQAIDAGATSTQAAIIANNTGAVAAAQWAEQAQKIAEAYENAQRAAHDAQYADITPGGDNSFGFFQLKSGIEGNTASSLPINTYTQLLNTKNQQAPPNATTIANNLIAKGGVDAAINGLQGLRAGTTTSNPGAFLETWLGYAPGTLGLSKSTTITQSDIISLVGQLYTAKNASTSDKSQQAANLQQELTWLQNQPQSLDTVNAIASLKSSIDSLTNSTDNLNSTNQDMLSPYYSQDPRTSHIGFRSQGMATGGEVTVPGGYSANDNMLAQIPVASGEIVSVRRPGQNLGGATSTSTQITMGDIHITVQGGDKTDANAIGRTAFQAMQQQAKQLAAASR